MSLPTRCESAPVSVDPKPSCRTAAEPVFLDVIRDYEPRGSDEIKLRVGVQVKLLSVDYCNSGGEGWWFGEEVESGRIGAFPSAHVSRCVARTTDNIESHNTMTSTANEDTVGPMVVNSNSNGGDCIPLDLKHTPPELINQPNGVSSNAVTSFSDEEEDKVVVNLPVSLRHAEPLSEVPLISSSEIQKEQLQFIGSGAFGTVYRGSWQGQEVALKILNVSNSQVDREASYLCRLTHRNIVRFHGVCQLGVYDSPTLVMEFAHGGALNRVLAERPVLAPDTLLDWALQIATGMAYLHTDAKFVHRDLKSSNILIREPLTKPYVGSDLCHCTLVITDFGMACRSSELVSQQSKLGTVAYAAPEVCRQAGFSFKADVWSYGVVLWELLTLESPYRNMEQPRLLYLIAMYNYKLYVPDGVPELFSQILSDCWSPTPDCRPSFREIIARLECSILCDFLGMDPTEFSRIQGQWREAILAHYLQEEEAAAATLSSSSLTASSLCASVGDASDLTTEKELLQSGWESLDQYWHELSAREYAIGQKEEHYSRLVGTIGHQFTLLAVLAANHLKDMLPRHPQPPKSKPTSASRKHPFGRNWFRWVSASPTEAVTNTTIPKSSNKRRSSLKSRSKVGQRRAGASGCDGSTNTLLSSSADRLVGSTAAAGAATELHEPRASDVVVHRGGVPHISPPVDVKHVVHVDPDWITGYGLSNVPSLRLFPSTIQLPGGVTVSPENRANNLDRIQCPFSHNDPMPFDLGLRRPCVCSPDASSTPHHSHLLLPTIDLSANRTDDPRGPLHTPNNDTGSCSCMISPSSPFPVERVGLTNSNIVKGCRGTPRLLRKVGVVHTNLHVTDPNDVSWHSNVNTSRIISTSKATNDPRKCSSCSTHSAVIAPHEIGASHKFHPFARHKNSFPLLAHHQDAATVERFMTQQTCNSQESDMSCAYVQQQQQQRIPTADLESTERRRSASGPSAHSLQSAAYTGNTIGPTHALNSAANENDLLRLLYSVTSPPIGWPLNPTHLAPSSSDERVRLPSSSSTASSLCATPKSATSTHPCIESALWTVLRLAVSLSCLSTRKSYPSSDTNNASPTAPAISLGIFNPSARPLLEQITPNTTPNVANTKECCTRPGRYGRFHRWAFGKHANHSTGLASQVSGKPCVVDDRRRIHSVDRAAPPNTSVCSTCRDPRRLDEEPSPASLVAHHAEFGDPHSPFLGMLAGSGRRPHPISRNNPLGKQSSASSLQTPVAPDPRTHSSHGSSDFTMQFGSCVCHSTFPHPRAQPYAQSRPDASVGHPSFDTMLDTSAQSLSFHRCYRDCDYACYSPLPSNTVPSHPSYASSDPMDETSSSVSGSGSGFKSHRCHVPPDWSNDRPLTDRTHRSTQCVFCRRLSHEHETKGAAPKADSHPSLRFISYNPVAHSRDAYLKATQDGYLNHPVCMGSDMRDSGEPPALADDPPSSAFWDLPETYNMMLEQEDGEDDFSGYDHAPPSARTIDSSSSSSSSDSESGTSHVAAPYCTGQDEDGQTLVPTDGWDTRESDSAVPVMMEEPPRSRNHFAQVDSPLLCLPRRALHRCPAIRSTHKPLHWLGRHRSVSDLYGRSCSPNLAPSFTGHSSSPVRQNHSPCGPIVSSHSTFL